MIISFLVTHPIITALIWAAMYIFDYNATIWFARLYHQSLNRHYTYDGGVEMNPVFERDVSNLRLLSPRFLILLSLMSLVLILFGWMNQNSPWIGSFEFLIGAYLLLWAFIDLRHIRNLYFQWLLKQRPDSIDGHIRQSYWFNQRLISFDAFSYSVIYGVCWLASGRHFFLGGAFVCLALSLRHCLLAARKPKVDVSRAS